MKKLAILFIAFAVVGCEGKPQDKKLPSCQFTESQVSEINSTLAAKYEELARCDELMKCLGYGSGQIIFVYGEYNPSNYYHVNGNYECRAVGKAPLKKVPLSDIGAMLTGCRGRKCSGKGCK